MIIPSIDLQQGKAVQLRQGRDKVLEKENSCELAEDFDRFSEVAVIDLDAALGWGDNEALIKELCGRADCRVGGGIRSLEKAARILNTGAHKIIIGTRAFTEGKVDHAFLRDLCAAVGRERLMIAVDTFEGRIVTKGWREQTGLTINQVLPELEAYAGEFLLTCVEKEGMLTGTDEASLRRLAGLTQVPITAAGGIADLDEIARISALGFNLQLGMSLYTRRFELGEAFVSDLNWKQGLIPTIASDETGRVLMLAYSSRESLKKTFATGWAWYYSRSRKRLWKKGESSGHLQFFRKIRRDCDGDALLLTVRQAGNACHTGSYSCFGRREFRLQDLFDVVEERLERPSAGSYTYSLDDGRVRNKLNEEIKELISASSPKNLIWEAADVLYFLTVLITREGGGWEQVRKELDRRRGRVRMNFQERSK